MKNSPRYSAGLARTKKGATEVAPTHLSPIFRFSLRPLRLCGEFNFLLTLHVGLNLCRCYLMLQPGA